MKGRRGTLVAGMAMRTAALTAISLHALTATSCALTTSLTASSRCCTHYTLCYSEISPLAASDMQHQAKSSA